MAPLVYPATPVRVVALVAKVSIKIKTHTHTKNLFMIHLTHHCICCFALIGPPGETYAYPGAPGAKGLIGDSGFPGKT